MHKTSWIIMLGVAGLLLLSGIGILFAGVDSGDFEASTGLAWQSFAQDQPAISAYVERLELLIGVEAAGLGLLGMFIVWNAYRWEQRWSRFAMVSFPLVFGGSSMVFYRFEADGLGMYYASLTLICLFALLLEFQSAKPSDA